MPKKIAVYGTSLNPPGINHRQIVEALLPHFDEVIVVPCGPRPDKLLTNDIEPVHRAFMADLTFRDLAPKVGVDLFDLERDVFTRTHHLKARYAPRGEVYMVIGSEFVRGGALGASLIQKEWVHGRALWKNTRFVVLTRDPHQVVQDDLPPHTDTFPISISGSSREIRNKVFNREPFENLVLPDVASYIVRYGLYRGTLAHRLPQIEPDALRAIVVADRRNERARELEKRLLAMADGASPKFIVVIGGDGTMLHAIQKFWRVRLPFVGINAGHVGFLLNDVRGELTPNYFNRIFEVRFSRMLRIQATAPSGKRIEALAFNEALLQAERVADDIAKGGLIEVEIDGEIRVARLSADGVMVSSAAGSTAYAHAAGAHPMPLGTNNMIVQGLAAYSPPQWGEHVPLDSTVVFRSADSTGWRKLLGYYDSKPLGEVRTMRVRASRTAAVEIWTDEDYSLPGKLDKAQNQWRR